MDGIVTQQEIDRRIFDLYAQVAASRAPRRDVYEAPWIGREHLLYERFLAPLSDDGQDVNMLFGALQLVDLAGVPTSLALIPSGLAL